MVPVHLVNGARGTFAQCLFATDNGLLATGQTGQLIAQLVGVIACGVWSAGTAFVLFTAIRGTVGLRVRPMKEIAGLDLEDHSASAYPEQLPSPPPEPAHAGAAIAANPSVS